MAYTKQRLQHALRVIEEAKVKERQNRFKAMQNGSKYEFRRAYPAIVARVLPTYRDSDLSGEDDDEYDPASERKKKKAIEPAKQQRQKRKAEDGGDNANRKKIKCTPRDAAMRDSKEAYITVVLTSEKGKTLFRDLSQRYGTEVKDMQTPGGSSGLTDQSPDPMRRDAEARRRAQTYMAMLDQESAKIDNKNCRALRTRDIPTTACRPRNFACAGCYDAQVRCSGFLKGECKRCNDEGIECVPYRKQRSHAEREQPTDLPTPPSTGSSGDSEESVIVLGPDTNSHGTHTGNAIVLDREPPATIATKVTETIDLDTDSQSSRTGRILKILTHWAHPIDFQYVQKTKDPESPACDFCSFCLFGFKGLGPREVDVLYHPDEIGYQELGNGHRAAGSEPTRMCVQCALKRLYITDCERHTFQPIPGFISSSSVFQDYADLVYGTMEGRLPAVPKFKYNICSICPGPASYQCCTPQSRDRVAKLLPSWKEAKGCGLLVCAGCINPIRDHGGVLNRRYMRKHAFAQTRKGISGAQRADAEFLYSGSLLKRAYSQLR